MRLRVPERRTSFRADKWELYAQLALTERRRGRVSAAFDASERMRSREMLELLQLGRIGIPDAPSEELAAREQNLRRRIALLSRQIEPQPITRLLRGPDFAPDAAATRETLARMQQEYADLLLEIRESAPHSAELVTTRPATWRDVAARLPARAALIEYLASDSGVVAFVITRDTIASLDLGIDRHELARLIQFARAMIERATATRDDRWRAPMRRLHQHLIAPAIDSGLLRDVTQLVIVPHAELHYLPFAALPDQEGRFVVERFTLSFAPSASVWLALGQRRALRGRGVLALAPNPASLPASAREVAAVRRLMPGSVTVLTGAEASEAAFRARAGQQRVLHLATNGVLNKHNPLFSFVELASGQGYDGRLDVHEIFGLRLAADLVVLSACETALAAGAVADVPPGDDWVGLTRAFLHAGASDVIATLWSVEDQASARVMEQFYERYARSDAPAAALTTAQRRLLRETATAHPFYWAGLVLVGTGR
jgi:CHAT domain-containing protein